MLPVRFCLISPFSKYLHMESSATIPIMLCCYHPTKYITITNEIS